MHEKPIRILSFIQLLRPVNLLIMVLTGMVVRYGFLAPVMNREGLEFQTSLFDFILLMLVLVLIGGAGNVINDYFDVRVDRINKPDKVIVGRSVKRRVAMVTHHSFNLFAVLIC